MENKQYGGFWIRVCAQLIDLVIMLIVFYVPLSFIYGEEYWMGDRFIYGFWDLIVGYVVPIAATIWFWLRFFGTPGKMIFRLRIIDAETSKRMSTSQAIGRYFAYIPAMVPLGLGLIWVGIDRKKQGWHDRLARTVVTRDTDKE